MKKVAIIGAGFVGSALDRFFKTRNIDAGLFDPPKGLGDLTVLEQADIIFIAVPTPHYLDGTGFDDSYLRAALNTVRVTGKIIVLKSTVLPGTTDRFQAEFPQHRILFNPEFLTESRVDFDMQHPNRQIVGFTDASRGDAEVVMELLPRAPFEKIIPAKPAEFVKCMGNSFYALKVSYANQMYDLCTKLGLEYDHVKECLKAEPWMGEMHWDVHHNGYRGYGGKCLPKDARSTIQLGDRAGVELTLLKLAEAYNNELVKSQGLDITWEEGSPKKNS
ncbi:hypothetical protein A3E39_01225 [Candidatus Uhrbacteria bacterium RIFCSPHIGHO2_12_FULL_60_25]|uniref:UDP-glucose/GDP-mannose dehydrogenase dimerisation domain-containing protein n=1 Tax=Candidatus Uhrbacteria bacterium RIFCSPHIGHO2_12_FULL_60_25 TaxID=1802399 RepID=A0A1F7UKJ2_9BACT|nr:MAG: hypothetical protein A3D73_02260 [Candidatus Uhrbacteria bacterium RIFCSPHIGHO2_02_FULL_60_44]OGL78765.1 MAG: hypothetical protein A3E39_01225 [Candidatus Uhrbacteria bacterium RIFCSPHIGHO2_12_FULL_60_25]